VGLFGALALILIFYWFFRSPLCSACTDWVRGNTRSAATDRQLEEAVERLTDEVHALKEETVDLAERLDFSERMLAQLRQRDALPLDRPR
jgi:hypothetical protein